MDHRIAAFSDELCKIAVTSGYSHFRQSRRGRRPVRVQTVLDRERRERDKTTEEGVSEEARETESGSGFSEEGESA